jgi:hypothetical protein
MTNTIYDIPNQEFIQIKIFLDSFPANDYERSKFAINYLEKYNLPKKVTNPELIDFFYRGNTIQNIWKWLYLLERSIPYYEEKQPEWQQRLLYFPATYLVEKFLNYKTFYYRDVLVTLRFATKISGDHTTLEAGPAKKSGADFYIYYKGESLKIDYKFASVKRFATIEEVKEYYKKGKHLHTAKLLLSFLEAEEKFYLIDYTTDTYQKLDFPVPNYISSTDIDEYNNPLVV